MKFTFKDSYGNLSKLPEFEGEIRWNDKGLFQWLNNRWVKVAP